MIFCTSFYTVPSVFGKKPLNIHLYGGRGCLFTIKAHGIQQFSNREALVTLDNTYRRYVTLKVVTQKQFDKTKRSKLPTIEDLRARRKGGAS